MKGGRGARAAAAAFAGSALVCTACTCRAEWKTGPEQITPSYVDGYPGLRYVLDVIVTKGGLNNAMAVYTIDHPWQYGIMACYHDGTGWGDPMLIMGGGWPRVAMCLDGTTFVMKPGGELYSYTYEMRIYDPTSGWAGLQSLCTRSQQARPYGVAVDRVHNSALAVYGYRGDALPGRLYARRYVPASGWGDPVQMDASPGAEVHAVRVAMNDNNMGMVVYDQTVEAQRKIFARRFTGTTWGASLFIGRLASFTNSIFDVALSQSGRALVVCWEDTGSKRAAYSRYWNGNSWTSPKEFTPSTTIADMKVRLIGNDRWLAVYTAEEAGMHRLYARICDQNTWSNGPVRIDGGDAHGDVAKFRFASGHNGTATVMFSQGGDSGLWSRRYEGGWGKMERVDTIGMWGEVPENPVFDIAECPAGTDTVALYPFTPESAIGPCVIAHRYEE